MNRPLAALIAGGLLLAGCSGGPRDGSGQVTAPVSVDTYSIQVGDCVGKLETESATRLQLVPCAQEHYWEAFGAGTLTGEAFPGTSGVQDQAEQICTTALEPFLGISAKKSKFELRFLTPTKDSWAQNDRAVVCLLGTPGGGLTGTLRGAAK